MNPFLILPAVLGGLLALLLLIILFGTARVRITCRQKVRVVVSVLGIRFTVVSDEEPKPPELADCHDPYYLLRRERRKAIKAAKKAAKAKEKKSIKEKGKAAHKAQKKKEKAERKAQGIPSPNLTENLQMILALLKQLYTVTKGKFHVRVHRMHISVGSDDAAKTAVLYGAIVQSASLILQWLQTYFIPIARKEGSMRIEPDFLSDKIRADIDLTCSLKLRRAIAIGVRMLIKFLSEKKKAEEKAKARHKASTDAKAALPH